MFKNTAGQVIWLFAFDTTTGAPKTGDAANISAYLSKDGGAVTQLADTSATEGDATNAKGYYKFDVAQAESNADACLFTGKSSTANISVVGQLIYTLPASFTSFVTPDNAGIANNLVNTNQMWDLLIGTTPFTGTLTFTQYMNALPVTSADALLNRDMSVGTDSGSPTFRTMRQALYFLRNKWAVTAGVLTVNKTDDTTPSWTATVSTDAAAIPIIGNDPA